MPRWARLLFPSVTDLIFVALLVSLSCGVMPQRLLGDAGTGWHIRDGQQIVSTHTLPRTDSFSSTMSGKRWYAWEWLYDSMIGLIFNAAGLNGVVLFSGILIALSFTFLFRIQLARGSNLLVAVFFLLLSASSSTIHFLARPHVVTWLFTLFWVQILDSTDISDRTANGQQRILYWLPALMLLWVNLHGGFLMGFVLLGIYLIAAIVQRLASRDLHARTAAAKRARILIFISALCLLASFVNPYGYKLHSHVYAYLSNHFLMNHIEEFQSPNFHALAPRCFVVLLLFALFTLSVTSRRARPSQVLLVLFATYSGLYASRNIPIASMLVTVAIAPLFSAWKTDAVSREYAEGMRTLSSRLLSFSQRMGKMESRQYGHVWPALVVLFSLLICAHQGHLGTRTLMNAEFDAKRFPVRATDLISAQQISDPIFSLDSWGGYLIYRLYPRVKVVVDDRHDLYGEQFLKDYLKVIHVEPGWDKQLDAWKVTRVLLPANSALSSILKEKPDWKIINDDGVAILFLRSNAP